MQASLTLPAASGWLRNPRFDALFIGGVLLLSLALGAIAMLGEQAFMAVLTVDVWLIAYPHVASMYTRIAFDRRSARRHWFFLTALYPIVFCLTALGTHWGGLVFLNSLYFYWQTFHYSRQSYGISRAYLRSGAAGAPPSDHLTTLVVAAFPVWGLLNRASEQHAVFYSAALYSPAVPAPVATFSGAVALTSLVVWLVVRVREGIAGPRFGQTLFVLSHVAMTTVSYVLVREITAGWLFINVWHNAQYILFVWAFNVRAFRGGVDPERRAISWLSQPNRVLAYGAVCLALSTAIYGLLWLLTAQIQSTVLPFVLIVYLAFNFHHYVVDAYIWRSPRPARASDGPSGSGPR